MVSKLWGQGDHVAPINFIKSFGYIYFNVHKVVFLYGGAGGMNDLMWYNNVISDLSFNKECCLH